MEIGLGTPRNPVQIMQIGARLRLKQPATGYDLTDRMTEFANRFLTSLDDIDGFILKSRSPSCGIKDVKIHASHKNAPTVGKGAGLFAARVLEFFGDCAIEDEGRLLNLKIRDHFLERIFAFAELRGALKSGSMGKLAAFHTQNKLMLMAHNQKELKELGKIVANHEKRQFGEISAEYNDRFRAALKRPAREGSNINVLMHAMGYYSERLTAKEKAYFLKSLENYRRKKISLATVIGIMKAWTERFEDDYLQGQTYFEPYPEDLLEMVDSGRGREI
jgi:uncharacterized protein YbgA (DUF1722 family)